MYDPFNLFAPGGKSKVADHSPPAPIVPIVPAVVISGDVLPPVVVPTVPTVPAVVVPTTEIPAA